MKLSSEAEISKSALSDYETGKSKPGLETLIKLSLYFNIPLDQLNNSDISEFLISANTPTDSSTPKKVKSGYFNEIENERYDFHLKLLNQKLESTKLQMQLLRQLLESREAEIKTLKINLKLLEEQLKRHPIKLMF